MTGRAMTFQAYIDNIEEKTGKGRSQLDNGCRKASVAASA